MSDGPRTPARRPSRTTESSTSDGRRQTTEPSPADGGSSLSKKAESTPEAWHEGVDRAIDGLEKRTNKSLEASNAAIAVHIQSLSERLTKVEKAPQAGRAWLPKQQQASRGALKQLKTQAKINFGDNVSESSASTSVQRSDDGDKPSDPSISPNIDPDVIDPDERQCHYSSFVAVTEKNLNCVSVLSWSMCRATRQSSTLCGALAGLLPPIMVVLLQCVVLHAISLEALNPACNLDTDCRAGMWCAPSRGFTVYQRIPGKCEDCLWAGRMRDKDFSRVPSWLRSDAYDVMDPAALSSAAVYCDAMGYVADTDDAERCDYLDKWHDQLTLGPFFVLLAVIAVVLLVVVADLDADEACVDVFVYRLDQVATLGSRSRGAIRTVASIIFNIRTFVLPGLVARTYIALVLTGPSGPGLALPVASVLAGVAVCLVYLADRMFALAFLDDGAFTFVREAYSDEAVNTEEEKRENPLPRRVAYFGKRFYAICLGLMVLVVVLTSNTLMNDLYMFDLGSIIFEDGSVKHPGPHNNCTNVAYMLDLIWMFVVIACMVIWFMTYQAAYKFKRCSYIDPILAPVVAVVAIPILSSLLSEMLYTHLA